MYNLKGVGVLLVETITPTQKGIIFINLKLIKTIPL